jgi:hypothetical protein
VSAAKAALGEISRNNEMRRRSTRWLQVASMA